MEKIKIDVPFKNNSYLALWKLFSIESEQGKDVFLTHGTFSHKKVCMGIGEFLVKNGYTCWILEWRNHGDSSTLNEPYNFEKIGIEEIETAFDYLQKVELISTFDCVTHSGGGISLTINLIENPKNKNRIKRIVFFGCQSFGAGQSGFDHIKLRIAKLLTRVVGFIPGKLFGRPHNETYDFMKQWFDWNIYKNFIGKSGNDYQAAMPSIQIPILSICGAGDNFIAPIHGCKIYLDSFKNPQNQLMVCGKASNFLENYSHSRLIYSRNAEKEIYPTVLKWIGQ